MTEKFKILATALMVSFIYTKSVIADELEDRVKELEAKIAEMENMKALASSGGFTFILMSATVIILGFIVSLIAPATLRRREKLSTVVND